MLRIALASLALLGTAAGAAPLCRDSKGLFTPCPPGRIARHSASAPSVANRHETPPAETAVPHVAKKPPILSRTRLCRDSKGLFTPCPH